jgi:hypothetical protein
MSTTSREIAWRHDFDRALEDTRTQQKQLLVDFSAAPM